MVRVNKEIYMDEFLFREVRDFSEKFGRRKVELPDSFPPIYNDWKANKITAVNAMDQLGMKRNTFY